MVSTQDNGNMFILSHSTVLTILNLQQLNKLGNPLHPITARISALLFQCLARKSATMSQLLFLQGRSMRPFSDPCLLHPSRIFLPHQQTLPQLVSLSLQPTLLTTTVLRSKVQSRLRGIEFQLKSWQSSHLLLPMTNSRVIRGAAGT